MEWISLKEVLAVKNGREVFSVKSFSGGIGLLDIFEQLSESLRSNGSQYVYVKVFAFIGMIFPFFVICKLRNFIFGSDLAYSFSIRNLYNSCRKSLVFYNNFPIEIEMGYNLSEPKDLENFIRDLLLCIMHRKNVSKGFRAYRRARAWCDESVCPKERDYFVILAKGAIYKIPISVTRPSLEKLILELFQAEEEMDSLSSDFELPQTFTVCSAMARYSWASIEKSLEGDDIEKLKLLRESRLLMCLDYNADNKKELALSSEVYNRFFDKAIQICVDVNQNRLVFLFEHAHFDGARAANILEDLQENLHLNYSDVENNVEQRNREKTPVKYKNTIHSCAARAQYCREMRNLKKTVFQYSERQLVLSLSNNENPPADYEIQLAIFLAYCEIFSNTPSIYEPVQVAEKNKIKLDFIDPVPSLEDGRNNLYKIADVDSLFLENYKNLHRKRVTRSKNGLGLLSNLMQMTCFPLLGQRFNAMLQVLLEKFIVTTLPDFRFLYARDVMASNGSFNSAVTGFGTIVHRDEMIGIGYVVCPSHIIFSINSNRLFQADSLESFTLEIGCKINQINSRRGKTS